ncbi:unnamed protein product [Clonostachys byssicola]|uniref:Uncharacterized protein n=1 Tax=Clonostachys byssicola TaxID=160290 RepID=A0A9N9UE56_9HYPO|nr:unnamed protein product [Clonostachys byssicola]
MSSTPSPSTHAQPADQRVRTFVWPLSLSAWNAVDDSWAPPSQQSKEYEKEQRATAAGPRRKFVWPLSLRVLKTVDNCWVIHKNPLESSSHLDPTPQGLSYGDYVLNPQSAKETNTTNAKFVSEVNKVIQNTPIEGFFKNNSKFIEELARKAAALADDPSTPICGQKLLSKTVQVTMHQQVLYCDDSTPMRHENRWDSQNELIKAIARVTTRILPEGEGVHMRYIGQEIPNPHSLKFEELVELVDMTQPLTLESQSPIATERIIGRNLKSKVLEPLVYSKLPDNLLRPLLISVIVDWMPERQRTQQSTLVNVIAECGDKLEAAGFPRESVKFMIGQVGSDTNIMAVRLIRDISTIPKIENVVSVASENLDVAFSKMKSEAEMDEWVINTLYEAIMKSESKKNR